MWRPEATLSKKMAPESAKSIRFQLGLACSGFRPGQAGFFVSFSIVFLTLFLFH